GRRPGRPADPPPGPKVAALPPPADAGPSAPPPAPPAIDPADIVRLLQAHLKRVGCDPGTTDGSWNGASQKALDNFNRHAGTRFDVKVASLDARSEEHTSELQS